MNESEQIDAIIYDWQADARRLGIPLTEHLRRLAFAARTDGRDEAAIGMDRIADELDRVDKYK